jgi:hypothetical protein
MWRLFWAVLLGSWLMFVAVSVSAQADSGWADNVVRQLLASPVKYRREKEPAPDAPKRHAEDFYSDQNTPPDDAPLEDLLDYWQRKVANHSSAKPSAAVRERLLTACTDDPKRLTSLLGIFVDKTAAERVKKIWDAAVNNQELDADWRKEVRSWLVFHSPYFFNELTTLARKAKDRDGYVNNEEALNALAQQDWETARPLLQSFATGAQPRTAAAALNRLYRHATEAKESAEEEKYRAQLRAIVSDRNAPARARDTACDALSLTEWPGQDDWYLSLFEDEWVVEKGAPAKGCADYQRRQIRQCGHHARRSMGHRRQSRSRLERAESGYARQSPHGPRVSGQAAAGAKLPAPCLPRHARQSLTLSRQRR